MPTQVELVVGAFSILVGLAWAVWPAKMRRLQGRILYLGLAGDDEPSDNEVLIGRISGLALAALGAALVLGVVP